MTRAAAPPQGASPLAGRSAVPRARLETPMSASTAAGAEFLTGQPALGSPSVPRCALFILVVKISLATLGFGRTLRWVRRSARPPARQKAGAPPAAPSGTDGEVSIAATLDAVAMASALWPGRALCLEQSLTLYHYLGRQGVPVTLKLGIQPHPFQAHAWVERDGRPLNDFEEHVRHFVPLPDVAP